MKSCSLMILSALVLLAPRAHAEGTAFDELNDAQKKALDKGEQVYFDQKVDGAPWPRMYIYQQMDCTPEEAAAVTMDWELRPAYTSDLKSAKIKKVVSATSAEIEYVLHIPLLGDETFTLANTLTPYNNEASYKVDWHLVTATKTKKSEGLTRLEKHGNGTLMAIVNFIDPNQPLAGAFVGKAIQGFKDATLGFANQVKKERDMDQAKLQLQIQALRKALGH